LDGRTVHLDREFPANLARPMGGPRAGHGWPTAGILCGRARRLQPFPQQRDRLRLPAILAFLCTLVCVFVFVKKAQRRIDCLPLYVPAAVNHPVSEICGGSTAIQHAHGVHRVRAGLLPAPAIAILDSDAGNQLGAGAGLALLRGIRDCTLWPGRSRCTPPDTAVPLGRLAGPGLRGHTLGVFWPLLANFKAYYGAHYYRYATYTATSLPSSYGAYFLTDSAFGAAVFALAVAGVIGSYLLLRPNNPSEGKVRDADVAEGTLLLALVALPIITFCLVKIVHAA